MASSQDSPPSSVSDLKLPDGFFTVDQMHNLSSDKLRSGYMVSVIGFMKDFQAPYQTKGTDSKCTLEIVDHSVESGSAGLKVIIFWPEAKMPKQKYGVGDAVIVRNAKAQMYSGIPSLLANHSSEFHVLPASKISSATHGSLSKLWQSHPPANHRRPTVDETAYVIRSNSHVEDMSLPTAMEFEQRSMQSMNVKDKYRLLKDVEPDQFYNLIGEVIQVFDSQSNTVTVYLSDYTANTRFYNNAWGEGGANSSGRDGDEYGYTFRPKGVKAWPGPYGKLSIQLTLYDGHASFVREKVKVKDWVLLRNVQIKCSRMGGYLEGALRGDRNVFEGKVQVEIMQQSEEPDENDPRWREGVRRKHEWWKRFEKQKQELLGQAAGSGNKREGEELPSKKNSKMRRMERRAAGDGKAAVKDAKTLKMLDLNENIRCGDPQQPTVSLADIFTLRKIKAETGQEYSAPFNVCRYKANVRVVGFFPNKIEDFAVGHRPSEYDMLSDYSGGDDTDREEDLRVFKSGHGFPPKTWEWRFALEVVDADSKASKERMWLMVDNYAAQMLLNMDATNLRSNPDALREAKEQLCILWGDLEERKSVVEGQNAMKTQGLTSLETASSASSPNRLPGDQPPVDSDDEDQRKEQKALKERDLNMGPNEPATKLSAEIPVKNKAFTCCIKQYGIKVGEDEPSMANAGNGKRWERRFGLFGTQIG